MKYYFITCTRRNKFNTVTGTSTSMREYKDYITPLDVMEDFHKDMQEQFPDESICVDSIVRVY